MKDITFNELKSLVSKTSRYEIEDMGFADEDAFFPGANDRVAYMQDFFSEIYFLEGKNEEITYKKSNGHFSCFKFDPIEIPVNDEELIKIRDSVYDRGGDPNHIVLGIYELFEKPDYSKPNHQSRTENMLASFFVKS